MVVNSSLRRYGMKFLARMVFFSIIAMTAACMEQGSSPSNTTAPSLVTGGGTASPSNRSAGPVATASSATTATMQFGQPNVGSDYPPVPPHDQSAHAKDNIVPRTVVIDKGGKVTFNTFGVHEVAIYAPGTEPGDIDTSDLVQMPAGCPAFAPLLIDDDTNRIALYSQPCGPGPRAVTHTFTESGRHLVICAFLPHFEVQMYGWVIVRD